MEIHQEPDRLPRRTLLAVAATGVAITAAGVFAAWGITDCRGGAPPRAGLEVRVGGAMPEEVNEVELQRFDEEAAATRQRREETERLARFGWVDRDRGVVHIPIDRAIDLYLAGRGDPAGATPSTAARDDEEEAR